MTTGMRNLKISKEDYFDKVMGCWIGKNAGGTLGTPVEKMWGEKEPFALDYYLEIHEGGMPNDDLELQLIWMTLLEERGLDITCKDFADYWIDSIYYNPDEYGYCKTSLRLGLPAPVSGWYNNPCRDCMGCPIRSEIWACIAPGQPDVAAHYAWHDAVVDHAMGESVYGEMFNATMQSMAFFCSDFKLLVDFGLSVIPAECKTAQTIRLAMKCHADGMTWLDARNAVMNFAFHPNAQYSPVNLGFQTLGWLYGEDFGDILCKAVNCGWDTDCTAATIGALYGIIHGVSALPEKWTKPLGHTLATSEPRGWIRESSYPRTVEEFTERCFAMAGRVSEKFGSRISFGQSSDVLTSAGELRACCDYEQVERIYERRQDGAEYQAGPFRVQVAYPEQPVIAVEHPTTVDLEINSRSLADSNIALSVVLPDGFSVEGLPENVVLNGKGQVRCSFKVSVRKPECIYKMNSVYIKLAAADRPCLEMIPVTLAGARRYLVAPSSDEAADWQPVSFKGDDLTVERLFKGLPGTVYLKHFVYIPVAEKDATIGVPTNGRMKLWLDGKKIHKTGKQVPFRPSLRDDESNYIRLPLEKGWHEILIELVRGEEPLSANLVMSHGALQHGWNEPERTWLKDEVPFGF